MKKFICFITAVISVLNIFSSLAVADVKSDTASVSDICALFEAVGVLERNDAFMSSSETYVSRGEFSSLIVRMIGCGDAVKSAQVYESVYKDVVSRDRYAQEIMFCTNAGFFGENRLSWFYPEEKASVSWAVESVARALGYGAHLKANPQMVYSSGLSDGIRGKYLLREDAVKLLHNALDVCVLEITGVKDGDFILDSTGERNYLSVYHKTECLEEIMLADAFTSVWGEKAESGKAVFESGTYAVNDIDTRDFVGLNLRFYYTGEGNQKEILYIEKLDNKQIILGSDNSSYNYHANRYTSEIGGKTKNFPMELGTMVSYNGKPHFDKNKMLPSSGEVKLIDNDSDGKYEVCIIREYTNVIAGICSAETERIFDAYDSGRNMDFSRYETYTVYNEKYEPVSLESVKKDSVLTVYVSADGKDAEVYISEKSAPAKLESISVSDRIAVIDGCKYRLSSDLRMKESLLKAGEIYSFYLNHVNEIVYASSSCEYETVYLMETRTTNELDRKYMLKCLSESGDKVVYELADKVRYMTYQNTKTLKKEDAYAILNSNSGKVNRQLMKVSTGFDGKINEIVIAYDIPDRNMIDATGIEYPLLRLSYYSDVSQWPQEFITYVASANKNKVSYKNGVYGYFMPFASGMREMVVPVDPEAKYSDDDVYSWIWTPLQTTPSAYVENFDAYCSNGDGMTVDFLVSPIDSKTGRTDGGYNLQPYLVVGVSKTIDENGNQVTRFRLANRNGNTADYYLADESLSERDSLIEEAKTEGVADATIPEDKTTVEKGDIIAAVLNSAGRIERLRLVYDGKLQRNIHPQNPSEILNSSGDIIVGKIVRISSNFVEYVSLEESDVNAGTTLVDKISTGILKYNSEFDTVEYITADKLCPDDIIHIYSRYGIWRMAVVYENLQGRVY